MLSFASRMAGWSDTRHVRRAFVLPLIAVVGLFLRSASATTQPSRLRAAVASVESRSPTVASKGGLLHPPAAVRESQRRTAPFVPDALAPVPAGLLHTLRPAAVHGVRLDLPRVSRVARGYDATAPPPRSV
jgi:hypothetical protein